jgi:RNA polymerase sigma factor (sigma-70 family)
MYLRRKKLTGRLTGEEVAALVRDAAQGDHHSWDTLVREFSGMIWAIARAHRLSDATAADVAQTTWLRLFEHLTDLQDPTRAGAWLATTARRECLRVIRDAQRNVTLDDAIPDRESSDPTPADALLLAERQAAVVRAFGRLRPRDRDLLRLLMVEPRLDYQEISLTLGIPIGSIGPTRARALERLKHSLANAGELALVAA